MHGSIGSGATGLEFCSDLCRVWSTYYPQSSLLTPEKLLEDHLIMDDYVIPPGGNRKVYKYVSSRGQTSLVWDYFGMYKIGKDFDKKFTICFLCGEAVLYPPDKSTSRQRAHIHNSHREIWDKRFAPLIRQSKPAKFQGSKKKKYLQIKDLKDKAHKCKVREGSETWKNVMNQMKNTTLYQTSMNFTVTSIKEIHSPTLRKAYSSKRRQQRLVCENPTEDVVYCLATKDFRYMSGIKCTGQQPSVLGNSRKGFHLCRHPDVLVHMKQVHGETVCELLQCKISVCQKMAISVYGSNNPIGPVSGHEAHVSFRHAKPNDNVFDAYNKSQIYVYDFGEDGKPLKYPANILPVYVIRIKALVPCVSVPRMRFKITPSGVVCSSIAAPPLSSRSSSVPKGGNTSTIASHRVQQDSKSEQEVRETLNCKDSTLHKTHSTVPDLETEPSPDAESPSQNLNISGLDKDAMSEGESAHSTTVQQSETCAISQSRGPSHLKAKKKHRKRQKSHSEHNCPVTCSKLDTMFTRCCSVSDVQRIMTPKEGQSSTADVLEIQPRLSVWMRGKFGHLFDPNISVSSATSDSDIATEVMDYLQANVTRSPKKRKGQEINSTENKHLSPPAAKKLFIPRGKIIAANKLVKRSKRTKVAKLLRVKESEAIAREISTHNRMSLCTDNERRQWEVQDHGPLEMDTAEDLPINYSLPFQTSTRTAALDDEVVQQDKSWLPSLVTYWLSKELEETNQTSDSSNSKLTEHLKETLAYFEEKAKSNDHNLARGSNEGDVQVKVENVLDTSCLSAPVVPCDRYETYSTVDSGWESADFTSCVSGPLPAHQHSRKSTTSSLEMGKGTRSKPQPAHQRLFTQCVPNAHRCDYQNTVNTEPPLRSTGVLPLYVSYGNKLVSLSDQVPADERPLDYCVRENSEFPVNLNQPRDTGRPRANREMKHDRCAYPYL